jgi:hypothetical protein
MFEQLGACRTGRIKSFDNNKENPGPGAYSPSVDYVRVSSPKHSLGGRANGGGRGHETPGPAAYYADRPSSAPAFSFKARIPMSEVRATASPDHASCMPVHIRILIHIYVYSLSS